MYPKIYIGPMSLTIVDTINDFNKNNNYSIGFIASRRQIEYWGGYVNCWTTDSFAKYIRESGRTMICRDHAGPQQGIGYPLFFGRDDYKKSLSTDCHHFNLIHIDPWKTVKNLKEGIDLTVNMLCECDAINPDVEFEIGTEEAIFPMSASDIETLINMIKIKASSVFDRIRYVVVQGGTRLLENSNVGVFNETRLKDMVSVCKKYGLMSKEHNGDYLNNFAISKRFKLGLDAINIAPEFGQIETSIYLDFIKTDDKLYEKFFLLCYNSHQWEKWIDKQTSVEDLFKDKDRLINICGHYVFSYPLFCGIKNLFPQAELKVKKAVSDKLLTLLKYGIKTIG